MLSKTAQRNLEETTKRIAQANKIGDPHKRAAMLAKLRKFVGNDLYRKAVSHHEASLWFAADSRPEKVEEFGGVPFDNGQMGPSYI